MPGCPVVGEPTALERLSVMLTALHASTQGALEAGHDAALDLVAADDTQGLVDTVALVQDFRRKLADLEADLVAVAADALKGRDLQGNLFDGRQWKLHRTADRKAWDHDDWKRDARRAIQLDLDRRYGETGDLVDLKSGEAMSLGQVLQVAMAEIQEVHGSTAPRTTALRRLGLSPDDYCETKRGSWKLDTIAPSENHDQED